jgi:hypothetical protein
MRAWRPIAIVALTLLAGGFAATPAAAKREMRCNGTGRLCERPFNRVVLPGAHNAMSAGSLGWRIPNQSVAIPEQLETGIRALLIDTHYGRLQPDGTVLTDDEGSVTTGERGLYLCHVLCQLGASPLVDALHSIRKFIRQRPNNVLAIMNEDKISPEDFAGAMEQSGLIDYVYSGAPGPRWPTMKRMIRTHQQVVVLAERNAGTAYPWYHNAYDGIVQETPYTFDPPTVLTEPANWPASCEPNRGGTTGSLFLINHWSPSTPPPETNFATSEAVNAADVIEGRARQCTAQRGIAPSIIAVDQFAIGGLFAAVRQLNGTRR